MLVGTWYININKEVKCLLSTSLIKLTSLFDSTTKHETNPELHVPGFFVERVKMSKAKERERAREESQRAMEEYLKKGGKIKQIPEGMVTDAKDMKFKYRKPAIKTKKKD